MTTLKQQRTAGRKAQSSKLLQLIQDSYLGKVEEIDDPEFRGRCRVRVFGVYGDEGDQMGKIPTGLLPWAYPHHELVFSSDKGSGRFSTPKMGAIVRVIFEEDQYHPRYFALEEIDPELQKLLRADYHDFQALMFDSTQKLKIYYAKKTGLLLEFDDALINLTADGAILVHNRASKSSIEMREGAMDIVTEDVVNVSSRNSITLNSDTVHANGAQTDIGGKPIYSAVSGEPLFILLKILATATDLKYPPTPGQFAGIVDQMKGDILSKTVTTSP